MLISQDNYRAGLARIRSELEQAQASGEELIFRTDLAISMLWGLKTDN